MALGYPPDEDERRSVECRFFLVGLLYYRYQICTNDLPFSLEVKQRSFESRQNKMVRLSLGTTLRRSVSFLSTLMKSDFGLLSRPLPRMILSGLW